LNRALRCFERDAAAVELTVCEYLRLDGRARHDAGDAVVVRGRVGAEASSRGKEGEGGGSFSQVAPSADLCRGRVKT
jgi:hypothetical protein